MIYTLLPENNNSELAGIVNNELMIDLVDTEFRAFHTKQGYVDNPCDCHIELKMFQLYYFELLYLGAELNEIPDCVDWTNLDWSVLETAFGFTIADKLTE